MMLKGDKIPVHWWNLETNLGDLLAPWLVSKMTGREVVFAKSGSPNHLVIGSILGHVGPESVVWGAGSFGTESVQSIHEKAMGAEFRAVRGPITRSKLSMAKIKCPRVYGDPALLVPDYHPRNIEPTYEVGLVIRWKEAAWREQFEIPGVKLIDFGRGDIEAVLDELLSCRRIISSSLHGLVLADAYDIPNAWLSSETPRGAEYKYWDYFSAVRKLRDPVAFNPLKPGLTLAAILDSVPFDGRSISIDLDALRIASPFL